MARPFVLTAVALLAGVLLASTARAQGDARYLYVWMGDEDGAEPDFMAVVDVRPESPTYARVIDTEPVDTRGSMPHHTEYWLPPPGRLLFANGHHHEQVFLFDLSEAERPLAVRTLPPLRYPHDMVRLPSGNVLVGYLRSDGPSPLRGDPLIPGGHGGIAEFGPEGRPLRWASAADTVGGHRSGCMGWPRSRSATGW